MDFSIYRGHALHPHETGDSTVEMLDGARNIERFLGG